MAAFPLSVDGQVLYGSLTGNVSDQAGGAVPNAKVEARSVGTGIVRQTTTDERGVFLLPDVQAGAYQITPRSTYTITTLKKNSSTPCLTRRFRYRPTNESARKRKAGFGPVVVPKTNLSGSAGQGSP
ncbi:MAG TPA: carboxypeptidase-like regulatory domain-containing protein [Bryobacteraceae bacterium]|nr:carboxypeptidase-like regulatory domain-containing protein [Bryobacteraceae bacterium]